MAKVTKAFRLDGELIEQVQAVRNDGETDTALYVRLISRGVESYKKEAAGGADGDTQEEYSSLQADTTTTTQSALIEALQSHIDDLQKQLDTKDGQIAALQNITQAAQALHGGQLVQALPPTPAQQSRVKRAFLILTGKDK